MWCAARGHVGSCSFRAHKSPFAPGLLNNTGIWPIYRWINESSRWNHNKYHRHCHEDYGHINPLPAKLFSSHLSNFRSFDSSPLVRHICVGEQGQHWFGNRLSPVRCQAITWTNDALLPIRPLRTNFSGILIESLTFSLKKIHLKMLSARWQPFCLEREMRWATHLVGLIFCEILWLDVFSDTKLNLGGCYLWCFCYPSVGKDELQRNGLC